MTDIESLFDFKRQMWVREVRAQIEAEIRPPKPPPAPRVSRIDARIDARLGVTPPPPCSECGRLLPAIRAADQRTCSRECSHARRCRLLREDTARRTAKREARKLAYHDGISARWGALSRELQDAEIARWCAEWRERQRRGVVGRYGVRR